ncbi:MAG: FmdB family zinc ribbon protein [Spirochaetota bacterium]|nr:FmdB family zinc ribbon protein [Spirochaetota bacterium]
MPTYDYECTECGHTFEYFQSMSDEPLSVCPNCGGKVKRLIGGGMGIIFKGSGFYVTDNRGKSSSKESSEKKADASKSTASKSSADSAVKSTVSSKKE